MALTKTWTCNKDARIAKSGSFEAGAGASSYLPVGLWSGYTYRALLGFTENWSGISKIVSAKLRIRVSGQHYIGFGSDPDIYVERLTGSWSEGSSDGLSSGNAVTWANQPAATTSNRATKDVSTSEGTWIEITITDIIEDIAPTSVKKRDGSNGGNAAFTGLRLRAVDEGSTSDTTEFYSSETSSDPQIIITYDDNEPPNAPTITSPKGGTIVTDTTPDLVFVHSDPDGDACSAYDIEVSTDSSFSSLTHWNIDNQTSGISGSTITRAYAGTALTRGTTYYWRARTKDPDGEWGAWSATASFKVNRLPTATKTSPVASGLAHIHNLGSLATEWTAGGTDAQPRLSWSFSDADGDTQSKYRVRIYDASSGGNMVYDSGEVSSSSTSHDAAYGMPNGDQASSDRWWTIEVWDSRGDSSGESSRTAFSVLWGQAIYEYAVTGGTNSSSWAFQSGGVAANTQKAFLFRSATGTGGSGAGSWKSSIGSVTPNDYLNVLVRIATQAAGTSPDLADMTFTYVGSAVFPDKWQTQADVGYGNASDWTLDVDTRRFGTRSLRCAISTTSVDRWIWPEEEVPVSGNTEYVFSAFVRTDGVLATGAYLQLRVNDADSFVEVDYDDTSDRETSDTSAFPEGWQRLTLRFTTGLGVTHVRPEVLYHHNGTTAGDVFWIDAVKLEEGTVATAWAPGAIGSSIIDSGGVAIDGSRGGIFRLRGVDGTARDMVELGDHGFIFGGDVEVYSEATGELKIGGDLEVTGAIHAASGGADEALYVGDDAVIFDADSSNALGIKGQSDPTAGAILIGSNKDIRIERHIAGRLRFTGNGTANNSEVGVHATTGQRAKFDVRVGTDVTERAALWGDATLQGITLGGGSGGTDVQLYRDGANVLRLADGDKLVAPNIFGGSIPLTPSAANTPTSVSQTFPGSKSMTGTLFGASSADTTQIGTTWLGESITALSSTSITMYGCRTNTTTTTVSYVVVGR